MTSSRHQALALLSALALVAACGSSVEEETTGSGGAGQGGAGQGGSGGDGGGGPSCELVPPGPAFSFVITNVGTRELRLAFGCGETMPITLSLPGETLGIGAGNADYCEVSCEYVYGGGQNWGCSDCGPGSGAPLGPGVSVTIPWDRRVYRAFVAPEVCSGNADQNGCALPVAVDTSVTAGTLSVCTDSDSFGGGYCSDQDLEPVPFTIDWSLDSVAIDVQ